MKRNRFVLSLLSLFLLFVACSENRAIVNNVEEREANEIVVILATKNIPAQKVKADTGAGAAGATATNLWNIFVDEDDATRAMSILTNLGLPRKKGQTLLQLFAKQGLMTSEKEEKIRYQAGIEEELRNTIRKMDGILDADVQISFPTKESILPEAETTKMKAAVYVKHRGVLDDPNNHLETKIKRLVSGSIDGLDFEAVSVISDRSHFSNLELGKASEIIGTKKDQYYVNIWSMIMTKSSATKFRIIFFIMIFLVIIFGAALGLVIYKFHPFFQKGKEQEEKPAEKEKT
jgi:type III secretion protein J